MQARRIIVSNQIRKICIWFLLVAMLIASVGNVFAEEVNQSYLYGPNNFVKAPIAAEPGRDINHSVIGTTTLKNPSDLYATEDYLYIVDTGNNRILKVDKDYKLVKEYTEYTVKGIKVPFAQPQGVYVDEKENLLVADTNNGSLVKLTPDGEVIDIYEKPESKVLPTTFNYLPSKVVCDAAGRIFVAVSGFNMGLVELDSD